MASNLFSSNASVLAASDSATEDARVRVPPVLFRHKHRYAVDWRAPTSFGYCKAPVTQPPILQRQPSIFY